MYATLHDPRFDQRITLRDAYRIMERFVEAHVDRGTVTNVDLLSYLGVLPSGETGDPAAVDDYLEAADAVLSAGDGGGDLDRRPNER
jgi:hypothetical protein